MTISNEALRETFIADAIFEIKVDERPSLDEKLQYTRVAQRAITAILDGFVEGKVLKALVWGLHVRFPCSYVQNGLYLT